MIYGKMWNCFFSFITTIAAVATTANAYWMNSPTSNVKTSLSAAAVVGDLTNVPVRIYSNTNVQVFEPCKTDQTMPCILFFTGLNGYIPYDIYSTFLTTVASKNISVHVPEANHKNLKGLVKELELKYKEVIPMSHSSSSMKVIDNFSKYKSIKKMIFLDPVNTNILPFQRLSLKYVNEILIVNAKKTYEEKPVPFIPPFFKITEETLEVERNCNVSVIESEEHGHCDLLNQYYSDIVHSSIKVIGSAEDRNGIYEYLDWMASNICKFVNHAK